MLLPLRIYLRHQVCPFVVLFIERDGSTYLISLLMSHPDILAENERFAAMRLRQMDGQDQLEWARDFFSMPLVSRVAAKGFKTKLVDVLDPEGFKSFLRQIESRIIHMYRRNHVKAVVSRINAKRLHESVGTWNLYDEKDRMSPMTIDPEEFDCYLRQRAQAEANLTAYVEGLDLPTLRMSYEDLLTDREEALAQVFDFLGVRSACVMSRTIKHTSDNLRDVIVNLDELKAGYRGTRYEKMFEEVLIPSSSD
jgi:LPS sulfotransferase NodH